MKHTRKVAAELRNHAFFFALPRSYGNKRNQNGIDHRHCTYMCNDYDVLTKNAAPLLLKSIRCHSAGSCDRHDFKTRNDKAPKYAPLKIVQSDSIRMDQHEVGQLNAPRHSRSLISSREKATCNQRTIHHFVASVRESCSKLPERLLSKAINLHYEKGKPHLAIPMYRTGIEKLKINSNRDSHKTTLRMTMNYARCLEECSELQLAPNVFKETGNDSPISSNSCVIQSSSVGNMWKAVQLYTDAIQQLQDAHKMNHSVKLHLRLAECYEKIGMFNKSCEVIKRCRSLDYSETQFHYDIGESSQVDLHPRLLEVFEAYYCLSFEKSIAQLKLLIEENNCSSSEVLWYSYLFFARKSSLHSRKSHCLASKAYEKALNLKPNDIIVGLEYCYCIQFVENNPRKSIPRYERIINIMRKHLDLPGMKKNALPQALFNLAHAYISLSMPESGHPLLYEAKALFSCETSNANKLNKLRMVLAKALEDCGDNEQAFHMYSHVLKFVEKGPKNRQTLQIDVTSQWRPLDIGELYCRVAVFFNSIGKKDQAENFFSKALVNTTTELATQIECLFAYSELLHDIGEHRKAKLMEDHLFNIVLENHGDRIQIPLKVWLGRLEVLRADCRFTCAVQLFEFLMDEKRSHLNQSEQSEISRRYAEYLQQSQEFESACIVYDKCITIDPLDVHLYVQKAWCLKQLQARQEDISKFFRKAIQLYEKSQNKDMWDGCLCYGEYGVFLHESSRLQEAEEQYLNAAESKNAKKSANYAQVCANLAVLYQAEGKSDLRNHWFRLALLQPAKHVSPWIIYMDYLITSKSPKTLKLARRMLQLFPNHWDQIFLRLGKYFEYEVPSNPQRVIFAYYMAMKADIGNCRRSQEETLLSIYRNTNNVQALAEFASALNYKMCFYRKAGECYEVLSEKRPLDVNIALHYGKLALNHLKDFETARKQFEKALRIDPGCALSYEYLAEYYLTVHGDQNSAENTYLQGIYKTSGSAHLDSCYHYALFLHNYHIDSGSSSVFSRLTYLFPNNAKALISVAQYLQSQLREEHRRVAKIKFTLKTLDAKVHNPSGCCVKKLLHEKQIESHTQECTTRIHRIADAIENASERDMFHKDLDVSRSLRRKNSSLYKRTIESLTGSMLSWNWTDFLRDPTHALIERLIAGEKHFKLDECQLNYWKDLVRIHKIYILALKIQPDDVVNRQHHADFLAKWMMDLPEAGKSFLRSLTNRPCTLNALRTAGEFFLQNGTANGLHAFIDIAKGLYKEIIESGQSSLEDLFEYSAIADIDKKILVEGKMHELLSFHSADERTISEILKNQSKDLDILRHVRQDS